MLYNRKCRVCTANVTNEDHPGESTGRSGPAQAGGRAASPEPAVSIDRTAMSGYLDSAIRAKLRTAGRLPGSLHVATF